MEIWKDIPNYEGLYQVSNLGRVKSLERKVKNTKKSFRIIKERIIKQNISNKGYNNLKLSKNNKPKTYFVHKLVAMAFLNHSPCGLKLVVDHIDNNSLNNKVENLQLISHRKNISKEKKGKSKYTGVSWYKRDKKWKSNINIKGKNKYLGLFENEYDAHLAYQKALSQLK